MSMTKNEEEKIKQGFEASTNRKSIEVFGLIGMDKQVKLDKNFVKLPELLILSIKLSIPNSYAIFPCRF